MDCSGLAAHGSLERRAFLFGRGVFSAFACAENSKNAASHKEAENSISNKEGA